MREKIAEVFFIFCCGSNTLSSIFLAFFIGHVDMSCDRHRESKRKSRILEIRLCNTYGGHPSLCTVSTKDPNRTCLSAVLKDIHIFVKIENFLVACGAVYKKHLNPKKRFPTDVIK